MQGHHRESYRAAKVRHMYADRRRIPLDGVWKDRPHWRADAAVTRGPKELPQGSFLT